MSDVMMSPALSAADIELVNKQTVLAVRAPCALAVYGSRFCAESLSRLV